MTNAFPSRLTAGFSFVEFLASIAILGLLATVALPLAETTVRLQKEHDLRILKENFGEMPTDVEIHIALENLLKEKV